MLTKASACCWGVWAGERDRGHGAEAEAVALPVGGARGGVGAGACAAGGAVVVALAGGAFVGEVVGLDGDVEGVF